ncbi:hypothetical protein TSAR_006589 [Trichomalopsis sarcophagae]|uniref:Uncharacterized protein n=1 Tax=Trichomalopsis sarcophagae TaxID=543379 RepID=A0A232EEX7_9HYME|nr:hypothetical protein TSAR_006589 [Trichomalopsis sarcophagae]
MYNVAEESLRNVVLCIAGNLQANKNLLADVTSDEDDITEYTSSENVEHTLSDKGEAEEEAEREASETEDTAQAGNAVADVQFVPAEMVGLSAADAHGEELRASSGE